MMLNPPVSLSRSITGRLYAVIGVMFIVTIATNMQTVIYSETVAAGASAVTAESVDGLRAADDFDDLLDQHRRTLTAATDEHHPEAIQPTVARLAEIETGLTGNPAFSGGAGTPSAQLLDDLIGHVAKLRSLSRQVLSVAQNDAAASHASETYVAFINEVEEDVTAWKRQMRETVAAELATMQARAAAMRTLSLIVTAGGCLFGTIAILVSRGVLTRLRRLTASMLSLAAGDVAAEIPLRGDGDEIGLLANALEVFREQAGRAMASEANMSAVIENMVEGIAMIGADRRLVLHNKRFVDMLDLPPQAYVGMAGPEILGHLQQYRGWPADAVTNVLDRLDAVRVAREQATFDIDLPDRRAYTMTAAMLPNNALLVSIEDVSERRASAARILHLAYHDTLTGLPNRGMFQDSLGMAVDDAVIENGIAVTLLLCDLDHFKEVNDTYGHPAGDELLQVAAQRMRETMRKTDILARLGGDEFAIIHLTGSEPQEAHRLAERILAVLQKPFEIHGNKVCIGASIGIACAPVDARSQIDLMKRADLALYAAKGNGRNMFMIYDAAMAEKLEERRTIETEMRKALNSDDFFLHYQPQVNLTTRRIIGFEALARWTHPTRGSVPPGVFIPIAEASGIIIQLGELVLRKACFDAAAWGGDTIVAVNVAAQQFQWDGFINCVRSALRDSGLPSFRLELEVTETAILNESEKMLAVLHTLRRMNVRLSLDDFGTGYSALNYLQKFPFDKIKIDQSFVRNLGSQGESDAIVRAVANLGMNLGITTIAEGVETEDQAKIVLSASCEEAQGFLFSRPVSVSEVSKLLAEQDATVLA
jgi:diguanylate cyclase (GGDEF)-like protein